MVTDRDIRAVVHDAIAAACDGSPAKVQTEFTSVRGDLTKLKADMARMVAKDRDALLGIRQVQRAFRNTEITIEFENQSPVYVRSADLLTAESAVRPLEDVMAEPFTSSTRSLTEYAALRFISDDEAVLSQRYFLFERDDWRRGVRPRERFDRFCEFVRGQIGEFEDCGWDASVVKRERGGPGFRLGVIVFTRDLDIKGET